MTPLDKTQLQTMATDDGSETLLRSDLGVTYRSADGAIGESNHVFIHASGLRHRSSPWRVLELGFGLGTNLLQLIAQARVSDAAVDYVGAEAAPIPPKCVPHGLDTDGIAQTLLQAARQDRGEARLECSDLRLSLLAERWQDVSLEPFNAHAIFHDPFDPGTNPDCWGIEVFLWEKTHLAPDGLICTYGAAGHVRRAMRDAGLYVAQAPGYGRKREMTLASLREDVLAPYRVKYRP